MIFKHFVLYSIRNKKNGRLYIGSTTMGIKQRWSIHLCSLKHNRHGNPELQSDWNRYGEKCFEVKVIRAFDYPDKLAEAEEKEISKHPNCYNRRKTCFKMSWRWNFREVSRSKK